MADELGRHAGAGAGVELGEDFFEAGTPLAEMLAVEEHHRHGQYVLRLDFGAEQRTVDHRVGDVRIDDRHQVECLDHVRAIVAVERNVGFEGEFARKSLDTGDDFRLYLGWIAAALQQRKDQRSKFMAHRDAGKADTRRFSSCRHTERRVTGVAAVVTYGDLVRQAGQIFEQAAHFLGTLAFVQRGHELDGAHEFLKIGTHLGFCIVVKHRKLLCNRI